ncbi:MAG: hypothetical protein A4E30_01381 [Methanomassiliicoccales archaeon PtaB.Bin215]|nr:MAG: hypothetical protein A4E30_01381 [Methanomassiliicoccales archaeon PtaB.Bin215]
MCTRATVMMLLFPLPSLTVAKTTGKAGNALQAQIGFTSLFSIVNSLSEILEDIK